MIKTFVIAIFFILSNMTFAASNPAALFSTKNMPQPSSKGNAGSTMAKLSEGCQKLMNSPLVTMAQVIMPKIDIATSPVLPFVGFAMGMVQYKSPVMQTCELVIKMDQLEIGGMFDVAKDYLNDVTANQFDVELQAVTQSFDVSQSLFDFKSGAMKPGALTNAMNHDKLKNLGNTVVRSYNKRKHGEDRGFETKDDRRREIEKISALSYKRAILQDAVSCPTPSGDVNYGKMWENFAPARQKTITQESQYVEYYYDALVKMGSDMISDVSEMRTFMNILNDIKFKSVTYRVSKFKFKEKNSEITTKLDKDGYPTKKDVTLSRDVNKFDISMNSNIVTDFRNKYSKKWDSFIQKEVFASGTFGLLSDKKGRLEAKYKSIAIECSEVKIAEISSLDPQDADYNRRMMKLQEDCRERMKFREKDATSLFDNYTAKLVSSISKVKKAQSEIWNFEAEKMGYNRTISDNDPNATKGFQVTEVACSNKMEESEMRKLRLDLKVVNSEVKMNIGIAKVKEVIQESAKESGNRQVLQENSKANSSTIKMIENNSNSGQSAGGLSIIDPTSRKMGL